MTDTERLDQIKSLIPVTMESDFDLCLLQAYFCGQAEGIKTEREKCMEVVQELAAEALMKIVVKEGA